MYQRNDLDSLKKLKFPNSLTQLIKVCKLCFVSMIAREPQ